MTKLLRFIAKLLLKVIVIVLSVPPFIILLLAALIFSFPDLPNIKKVYDWYYQQWDAVVSWFKEFWRNA